MPFNPTDELEMRLTVTEWNAIIGQLQEGPYKVTAPLINKINLQAAKYEQEQQKAVKGDGYTNGEMAQQVGDITAEFVGTRA